MSDEATMDNAGDFEDLAEGISGMEQDEQGNELEVTQQPNSVFRRALLGGYKTVDVDQYIERSKDVLDTLIEENKALKVKIDQLREGSITIRTALASSLKFSENISDAAKRETKTMLDHSRSSAQRFEEEVSHSNGTLSHGIEAIRSHRDRLTAEVNTTLECHIRLLDTIETNSMTEASRAKANELLELDNS
ncbi:MAG: DivIVA domain-containing protein [Candidatus Hydrogenedentota bacterium]